MSTVANSPQARERLAERCRLVTTNDRDGKPIPCEAHIFIDLNTDDECVVRVGGPHALSHAHLMLPALRQLLSEQMSEARSKAGRSADEVIELLEIFERLARKGSTNSYAEIENIAHEAASMIRSLKSPAATQPSAGNADGWRGIAELKQVASFLTGEAMLEGRWFGEDGPEVRGRKHNYWWRKNLREAVDKVAALASSPAEPVAWQFRTQYDQPAETVWRMWNDTSKEHFDNLSELIAKGHVWRVQVRALYALSNSEGGK